MISGLGGGVRGTPEKRAGLTIRTTRQRGLEVLTMTIAGVAESCCWFPVDILVNVVAKYQGGPGMNRRQ